MKAVIGKREVKRVLDTRMNDLIYSEIIDDTGFSILGHCFHIEVVREDSLVRYSMYGEPVAEVVICGEKVKSVDILKMDAWHDFELDFKDLIESACDIMGIDTRLTYQV